MDRTYLIEMSIYLAFFYLSYRTLLKNNIEYKFQRRVLIWSILIAFAIPLIPIVSPVSSSLIQINLNTVTIAAGALNDQLAIDNLSTNANYLLYLYLTITFILLFRFLLGFYKIFRIKTHAQLVEKKAFTMAFSTAVKSSFSFFNTIYIPLNKIDEQAELDIIINHELYHIKLNHTAEKIFAELLRTFFWWHPISHLISHDLRNIHEFEVDQLMIAKKDRKAYSEFLINQIHNFSFQYVNTISSNIKNRIKMMYSEKSRLNDFYKLIASVSIIALAILFHSCQKEIKKAAPEVASQAEDENYYIKTHTDTVVTFDLESKTEKVQIVTSDSKIYKKVDQMPQFPGCEEIEDKLEKEKCSTKTLLNYVYSNIKYPKAAFDGKIEGMVVSSFIVNKLGQIESAKIVKTDAEELNSAVLDMLSKMESDNISWIPGSVDGENVSVQYTLPVKFKI